jgi:REP element-mobilizing transposase RayT
MVAARLAGSYPLDTPVPLDETVPRGPRQDAPGLVHHIWARALDGRDVFLDLDDRRDIVDRLSRILPEDGARCFGWALMSNHLHLVLKAGARRVGTTMQRLLTGYAMRFNGRAGRQGHLFQGRFGSRPLRDDGELAVAIRYVLRNPLEAGLARDLNDLERYPWSGYGAITGRRPALPFESVAETLELFGPEPATARVRLRAWLADPKTPATRSDRLEELTREVCRAFGLAPTTVSGQGRTQLVSRARALICQRAVTELGLGVVEVARALGLSHAAVSQMLRRRPTDK